MNYGMILAGGVGQRMRNSGKPKQFLEIYGKPIIIYTLKKFENCSDIDELVVCCTARWMEYMEDLIKRFDIKKKVTVVPGGKDRQESVMNGMKFISERSASSDDIVVIHDGVRPLIDVNIISENIRIAKKYGSAMTVSPASETVVTSSSDTAGFDDFLKRDDTYNLTSPQTFTVGILNEIYNGSEPKDSSIPLLDTALAYVNSGKEIHIVRENNHNIKITTPEDYYILKAMLELEENKSVFGID